MNHYVLGMGLILALTTPTTAHHSWATNYRTAEPQIEITGIITQIEWKNPHVRMQMTVDADKPSAKSWSIESTSVAQLSRMDVTPNLMKVGQTVKVAGYAGIQSSTSVYMMHLLLPDNREVIFNYDASPRWPGEHIGDTGKLAGSIVEPDIRKRPSSIFAVWNTIYGDPKSHAAAAQKIAAAINPVIANKAAAKTTVVADVLPSAETYCAPKALPLAMGNPYPIQFEKSGKDVLLKLEENDLVRTIHISATHDDSSAKLNIMGYSTGLWIGEGEKKLVVTTTKIDNKTLGARTRLTETFELSADRNRLDYTSTLSDPDKPSAPATTSKYWQYSPGATIQLYNCSL